jgi:cell wall-associated NlpC family hydrolase
MRPTRLLLLLLAIAFTVALGLLRPLPGRAAGLPRSASPTSPEEPPVAPPPDGVSTATRATPRRALAGASVVTGSMRFGRRVAGYARHLLGTPYRYGGTSPRSGFDCSGFVRYVYSHFGVTLPHSSFADLLRGRRVGRQHLHAGDLVFFDGAGHVGIYVGRGRFIHAPHTGTVVRIETMSGWYGSRYVGARRLR